MRKYVGNIKDVTLQYDPPNNFFGLSLDKTDHVKQIGRRLSDDIRRLILFQWNKDQETSKHSG